VATEASARTAGRGLSHTSHRAADARLCDVQARQSHTNAGAAAAPPVGSVATPPAAAGVEAAAAAAGLGELHTVHFIAPAPFRQVHAGQFHGSLPAGVGRATVHVAQEVALPRLAAVHQAQVHSLASQAPAGFAELHTAHFSMYEGLTLEQTHTQSTVEAPGTGRGMSHTAHFTLQPGLSVEHRHSHVGAGDSQAVQTRAVHGFVVVHRHSHGNVVALNMLAATIGPC